MIAVYIFVVGVLLVFISTFEFFFPGKAFKLWFGYISSRIFFLHGLLLIAGGLPLVMYSGAFSTVIFAIGVIVILTGPFILIYSDRIKSIFKSMIDEMNDQGIRKLVYFDASVRLILGLIFVGSLF